MRMKSPPLLAVLLLLAAPITSADEVEVLPLHHRTVEQVLPVLQPLVDPGGALSGMGDSLIVRSSPENIEQIRQVLSAIDTAPRTLMIAVRQISGDSAAGWDSGTVVQRQQRDDLLQRVRTLEGNAAYIAIGRSVPIPSGYTTVTPGGTVIQNAITMHHYETGFTVVPRLSGDRVTLEIGTARDRLIGDRVATIQGVATTVSGRLGEWIDLSGIAATLAGEEGMGAASARNRTARIQVRVDELP